jgi:hypothetical protein
MVRSYAVTLPPRAKKSCQPLMFVQSVRVDLECLSDEGRSAILKRK